MGQGAEPSANTSHYTPRQKYTKKVLTLLKTRGFSHLRVEDIVRQMDISKATFYKYFPSREDVLEEIVDIFANHINEDTVMISDDGLSYELRFQMVFEQTLFLTSFVSEAFLRDLAQNYPEQWERLRVVRQRYHKRLEEFYQQGIAAGVFQAINPLLLVQQSGNLLRSIMDPIFLVEHDLALRKVLYDFYILQKYLVLTPETRVRLDDAPIERYIDAMAHKISSGMR